MLYSVCTYSAFRGCVHVMICNLVVLFDYTHQSNNANSSINESNMYSYK
jgi:hypothetical protein